MSDSISSCLLWLLWLLKNCCHRDFRSYCLWPLLLSSLYFFHVMVQSYTFSIIRFPLAKHRFFFQLLYSWRKSALLAYKLSAFFLFLYDCLKLFRWLLWNCFLYLTTYYIFVFYHNSEVITKDISSTTKTQKDSSFSPS